MSRLTKVTGIELLHLHEKTIPTKFESVNRLLEGGIRSGTITEIYGENSACKTAFCFEFIKSFLAQSDGNNALYISCARTISKGISSGIAQDRLFIEDIHSLDGLYEFVISRRSDFDKNGISLLVIDPIQFLIKNELSSTTLLMKVNRIMGALRSWVVETGSLVLFINDAFSKSMQTADHVRSEHNSYRYRKDIYGSRASRLAPSLGMTWSNNFDLRLELSTNTSEATLRIHLCKYLPSNNRCHFEL